MWKVKKEVFVLWFSKLTPSFPALDFHISSTIWVWLKYWPLSLTGCRNSLFRTNYLWPTLWSSSFNLWFLLKEGVTPLWHRMVVIFCYYSYIQMVLYYSGAWLAVMAASCCIWYFESILLWPYWFDCQSLNSTVRATTPWPVCMARSFLSRPWFHQLWMRYTAAAFIFSSSRSLEDYNTTEEQNIPHTGEHGPWDIYYL